jgi:hypothetical protein
MARVPNKGGPQFMSRALRPGGNETGAAPKKPFDLGSIKGPKDPMNATKPTQIGKGIKMAPPFKGNSKRGR